MSPTRRTVLAIAGMLAGFGQASGREPKIAPEVTAIDILPELDFTDDKTG